MRNEHLDAPDCACGCGQKVKWGRRGYRRFLNGHHGRLPDYQANRAAAVEAARGTTERNKEIRRRAGLGERPASLAREYGVSSRRILQILNPEKVRARLAVQRAIKVGELVRPLECSSCGKRGPTEAHHENYANWLDVVWLCKGCHARLDSRSTIQEKDGC